MRKGRLLGRSAGRGAATASGASRAGIASAGRLAGAAGAVAGGAVVAVGALAELHRQLVQLSASSIEAGLRLREVSAGQAYSASLKEYYDNQRDRRVGDATSATTRSLIKSDAARQNAEAEIGIAITNLQNIFLDLMNRAVVPVLEDIAKIARTMDEAVKKIASLMPGFKAEEEKIGIAAAIAGLEKQVKDADARARTLMDVERMRGIPARPAPRPPGA
jgi:hypothetical protein